LFQNDIELDDVVPVASGATQLKATAPAPEQSERKLVCNDHTEHTTLFENDIELDDVVAVPSGATQLKADASAPKQSKRELACNDHPLHVAIATVHVDAPEKNVDDNLLDSDA